VRYLILSDIHANLEALDAVMTAAGQDGYDKIICLGDIVGYGADPNACVDRVRGIASSVIRGNHDRACAGLEDLEWFNPVAKAAVVWTTQTLTEVNRAWVEHLPRGPMAVNGFEIVHGSPADEDEYVCQVAEASQLTGYLDADVTFFGHTHLQGGFAYYRGGVQRIPPLSPDEQRRETVLDPGVRYLINPGSVGQPRDGDPRASWAVFVPEEHVVVYRRIPYDIAGAAGKIVDAGLPPILARRLEIGQ